MEPEQKQQVFAPKFQKICIYVRVLTFLIVQQSDSVARALRCFQHRKPFLKSQTAWILTSKTFPKSQATEVFQYFKSHEFPILQTARGWIFAKWTAHVLI